MSKKAYARPQYKVKPAVMIIVAAIVFIFAALIVIIQPTDQEKIFKAYDKVGAIDLAEKHVFESIGASNLIKLIDTGKPIVVYFGTPSCSVCVTEIGWYDKEFVFAGLSSELNVIYYVNTGSLTQSSIKKLQDKYGMTLTGTPEVYYLNEGEIVKTRKEYTTGTTQLQIKNFFTFIKNDLA